MTAAIPLGINGRELSFDIDPETSLLEVLRNHAGLTASRFGCGESLCGACNVLVGGRVTAACNTPLRAVAGKTIVTAEGLGSASEPHPLQQAFIDEQAMQCGYCIPGILISAAALLKANPDPADADIRTALNNNLCRCGAHTRIVRAIRRAAAAMRSRG